MQFSDMKVLNQISLRISNFQKYRKTHFFAKKYWLKILYFKSKTMHIILGDLKVSKKSHFYERGGLSSLHKVKYFLICTVISGRYTQEIFGFTIFG
jgi:hypothetical protein